MQRDDQNIPTTGMQMVLHSMGKQEIDAVELLAYVSDALRNPLTAIKGSAETLWRHEQHLSQQERHEFLQTINQASDELAKAIEDLLGGDPVQRQKKKYRQELHAWKKQQATIAERLAVLRERQQALQADIERLRGTHQRLKQYQQEFERKQREWQEWQLWHHRF